ncbi:type I-E CRISPR-associated protein Cas6/Cse3/CasE [Oecophyllibacter saccharovorans]|uniref:Type I-E CRISPR-associated protein Cas6/Cse3/CasE n=1 Tax=Oecophyllibacter saccharovorans TaxID=2558360 RepID=A0A506URR6_9PROT|nr:type I-E CRISPR-associated protein Cas6/Cse3/CasE [Oecophyllibacter saccharovorans]TPW36002.1 type I-E CRISPR-associated protein Cas6/Cse3/CasE [Oecophyllibacter saccharovorans]
MTVAAPKPFYLLHAPLNSRQLMQWTAGQISERQTPDYGLALHRLLSASFGKGVVQPFRLFSPRVGQWSLYGYSDHDAQTLQNIARDCAPPETAEVLDFPQLRSKEMPLHFQAGKEIGFDVLVHPTRRLRNNTGKVREKDAWLCKLDEIPEENRKAREGVPPRETIYLEWLRERLQPAASLGLCQMKDFQRIRECRNGRSVEGPRVTFQGNLRIEEPGAFRALLRKGIGRHRAYGYGMILLRPVSKKLETV